MTRFRRWRWTVAALVSVCAFLVTQAPAMAATGTGGFTVLYASQGEDAHHCKIIGTSDDGYYQAVVCVDLITQDFGDSSYGVYGELEAYCQTKYGTAEKCDGVSTDGVWASGSGIIDNELGDACGTLGGDACPSGRFTWPSDIEVYFDGNSGCDDNTTSDHLEWTVAYANETEIILPDDVAIFGPSANYETGHYYICY